MKLLSAASERSRSYPAKPTEDGDYNVFVLGYSACTDAMATAGINLKIIAQAHLKI